MNYYWLRLMCQDSLWSCRKRITLHIGMLEYFSGKCVVLKVV